MHVTRAVLCVAFLLAATVAIPAAAQSRQTVSAQGSGLYTVQRFGAAGAVGGLGVEVQGRATRDRWSVGLGYQHSHHSSGGSSMTLMGVFLEPRLAVDVGSDRVAPYLAGRAALLRQNSQFVSVGKFSTTGNAFGFGAGLIAGLSQSINFDAGGALLRQSFRSRQLPNGAHIRFEPFYGFVVKAGISVGLGR